MILNISILSGMITVKPHTDHCHNYLWSAAVDSTSFQPDLGRQPRPGGRITVVALSRLVYRKGVDLLNVVIPAVCRRQLHVDFIIGEAGS